MGLEPTTFGSEVRRAIHYATEPITIDLQYILCFKQLDIFNFNENIFIFKIINKK